MSAGRSLASLPHVSPETDARLRKAKKSPRLCAIGIALKGMVVSEVGTGAGTLAAAARLPRRVLDSLHPIMATLIFVARR